MMKKHITRSSAVLFMLLNTVLWGAALPIVKPALSYLSSFEFLFYRFALASILAIPIILYFWRSIKHKLQTIALICGLELIGTTLALGLLYAGLARTSALEASLLVTTTPLFTTLAGIWYLKEKQERHEWLGLFIALAGTVLLTLEPVFTGRISTAEFSLIGNLMIIGQNIATAAYFVLAKKYYKHLPKLFVTSVSFFVGTISFFLISQLASPASRLTTLNTSQLSNFPVLLSVAYMSIFGSIIGLTAYIKGQDGMEASEASLFTYLQPLVYIPLSVFWLHEQLTLPMVLAMVLIGVGVYSAEKRKT